MVRRDRDRDGRVDARELLDRDRVRERVRAGAAVLLGDRHSHQPQLRELRDDLVREALLAVELVGDGRDLVRGERAHRVANELVFFREVEVQRVSARASSTMSRTP